MKDHRVCDSVGMFVPQTTNELIRVPRFDVEISEDGRREIREIECDDQRSTTMDRRRENVPVIGVGEV
jgi:hypothetical protein